MSGCLYECLQEAHLERYHPHFVRHGISKCEGLAALSMQDYSRFGITRMEDRVRLFKLVQIVKSVQAEGRFCKHETGMPLVGAQARPGQHEPQAVVKTRGQAFVQYLKSRAVSRPSGVGLLAEGGSRVGQQGLPQVTAESVMAPMKKKQRREAEVQYKPGSDSPIFKCRRVLTFSDSEDDEEEGGTPDTNSITDSEIRQKVLSTITTNPLQLPTAPKNVPISIGLHSSQRHEPIRVTVQPPKSFFIELPSNSSQEKNLNSNQISVKQNASGEALFGAVPVRRIFESSQQIPASQPTNVVHESPPQVSTQKRMFQEEEGNISAELLAKKSAIQARRQESTEKEKSESESDTETDEYFELPKPSSPAKESTEIPMPSSSNHPEPLKAIPVGRQTQSIAFSSQATNTKKPEQRTAVKTKSSESNPTVVNRKVSEYNPAKYSPEQKQPPVFNLNALNSSPREVDHHLLSAATAISLPLSSGPRLTEAKVLPKSALLRDARQKARRRDRGVEEGDHAYFPTSKPASSPVREPVVERVIHSSDYNYGVPSVQKSDTPSRYKSPNRNSNQRIRVCVRKRPLTRREQKRQEVDVVNVDGADTIVVDETKVAIDLAKYIQQHIFVFDEVFDETKTNKDVYTSTAKPLVKHIFNKGCATCFAFGQTGAGKTYTLLGTPAVPGLYRLAAADMFSLLQSGRHGTNLHLWVSYYEIYCGQLYDLLNKKKKLYVRENGRQRVCIAGLMETRVRNVEDVAQVVQYGNSVRSTGSTGVNPHSSRSHAVLQLEVRDSRDQRLGRMSFIDLAGSERASDVTEFDRQTRIEGAEINQSLLALKECIRSLDQESRHTPYRQSKLTHILRDSFIGNSRTCMIANISPSLSACENTLNTLRYADRVKELRKSTPQSSAPSGVPNETPTGRPFNPALFHPSNIQFASTPKQNDQKPTGPKDLSLALQDPSETPIRGHKIRNTPEKRKVTPPRRPSRSPSSPAKTNPFEFRVERNGGFVTIQTSQGSAQQSSSTGSDGRRPRSASYAHLNRKPSPKSASPHKSADTYRSPRVARSASLDRHHRNSTHKSPYNNENENSSGLQSSGYQTSGGRGYHAGRKSSHGTSDEGTDGEYYSPLKVPTVTDRLAMLGSSDPKSDSRYGSGTSPKGQHLGQRSSSQTRTSFIDEHRQILNHLDNIMDRAKTAIEKSSSSENDSPQKAATPGLHAAQTAMKPSYSSGYNQHLSQSGPVDAGVVVNRLDEYQRYDEGITQRSALYDLQNSLTKSSTAEQEPVKQSFKAVREDPDTTGDPVETEKAEDDSHMPDGHHFSPHRDDSDSNLGAEDGELLGSGVDTSSEDESDHGEVDTSEASTEASPGRQVSSDGEEYCSCSSHPRAAHANRSPGSVSRSLSGSRHLSGEHQPLRPSLSTSGRSNQDGELTRDSLDMNHKVTPRQSLPDLSRSRSREGSETTPTGQMHHSHHDISKHIENIRLLLSEEKTSAPRGLIPEASASSDERVPRISFSSSEVEKRHLEQNTSNQKSPESALVDSQSSSASRHLPSVPSSEFLQSLADIKVGQVNTAEFCESEDHNSRLSKVNPALARLGQTFKSPDSRAFPDGQGHLSTKHKISSFHPYHPTKPVSGAMGTSGVENSSDALIHVKPQKVEVSDSGIGTQGDPRLVAVEEAPGEGSEAEGEPVSSASTLDGVVSLSAQLEDAEGGSSRWEAVRAHRRQFEDVLRQQAQQQMILQTETDIAPPHHQTHPLPSHTPEIHHSDGRYLTLATSAGLSTSQTEIEQISEQRANFAPIHPQRATTPSGDVVVPNVVPPSVPPLGQSSEGQASEDQPLSIAVTSEDLRVPSLSSVHSEGGQDKETIDTPRSHGSNSSTRSSGSAVQRAQDGVKDKNSLRRNLVLTAHEDQLSDITALCKQEMRLLVAVRAGEKTFEEYIKDTEELLSSKAAAISTLRAQVSEFLQHPVLRSAGNTPR